MPQCYQHHPETPRSLSENFLNIIRTGNYRDIFLLLLSCTTLTKFLITKEKKCCLLSFGKSDFIFNPIKIEALDFLIWTGEERGAKWTNRHTSWHIWICSCRKLQIPTQIIMRCTFSIRKCNVKFIFAWFAYPQILSDLTFCCMIFMVSLKPY